jgi:hypothetical protein
MTDPAPDEPLEALRVRLEATQQAAERLVRETAEFANAQRAEAGNPGPAPPPTEPGNPGPERPRAEPGNPGAERPRAERIPPNGWEAPGREGPPSGQATSELQALAGLLETLRGVLPEDIQRQVTEIMRQLLLLVRALIDWWIARMDRDARGRDVFVQDIPIA